MNFCFLHWGGLPQYSTGVTVYLFPPAEPVEKTVVQKIRSRIYWSLSIPMIVYYTSYFEFNNTFKNLVLYGFTVPEIIVRYQRSCSAVRKFQPWFCTQQSRLAQLWAQPQVNCRRSPLLLPNCHLLCSTWRGNFFYLPSMSTAKNCIFQLSLTVTDKNSNTVVTHGTEQLITVLHRKHPTDRSLPT